jgi:hypothetical protein
MKVKVEFKNVIIAFFLTIESMSAYSLESYPGLTGGGAGSLGGRGGVVIPVTNLNDSGAGSLRACIKDKRPRTCVFTVGGTIVIKSLLEVFSPYLTIAGQTAPGGGILITNKGSVTPTLLGVSTHDVIVQYIRFRNAYNIACSDAAKSECGSTSAIYSGGYNVVLDHNSYSWNQDEGIGIWDATAYRSRVKNITISSNLLAEGLLGHSTGIVVGGDAVKGLVQQMTDIDIHHNLTMNNSHRNPLLMNKSSRIVNNIYYNQDYYTNQVGGGGSYDITGNLYKSGPLNSAYVHEIQGYTADDTNVTPGSPSIYLSGNKGYHQTNPEGDQWVMASKVTGENGSDSKGTPIPSTWRRGTPLNDSKYPINVVPVTNIENSKLPTVGASRRLACDGTWENNRDSVDTRLIDQYNTDSGSSFIPVNEDEVGGFPVILNGTACADTDGDGMFDNYEAINSFDPLLDDQNILDANGVTRIEHFLAGK